MSPQGDEREAREAIGRLLTAAGWSVCDADEANLSAHRGVAIREFPLPGHGFADYLLYVDGKAAGVVEAKKQGATLTGVETQSAKYTTGLPQTMPAWQYPLPFAYESTGIETRFTNALDPKPRSRPVFAFHRPQTLADWLEPRATFSPVFPALEPRATFSPRHPSDRAAIAWDPPGTATLQDAQGGYQAARTFLARLQHMPELIEEGLWPPQKTAIRNLEQSLRENRPRALIQMATGSGKTFTAISFIYRLIKFAGARRILFLVDRGNLADQTLKEFQQYPSPYKGWAQVLEYFDAYLVGLTATPGKQTFGFFHQNLVMEYNHEMAVADGVNVNYDVYRIRTKITEAGSKVESGYSVQIQERDSRKKRWEELDEDFEYDPNQLDRDVVAPDQIRKIIQTYRDKLPTEIFPGREWVPKTLIFAKSLSPTRSGNDAHAENAVHGRTNAASAGCAGAAFVEIVREEFAKGNDFAQKITYRTTGRRPRDLINEFRTSLMPRIAVTVDMIATGTDIKAVEVVLFMRAVKSRAFFEQMKGRGVRVIQPDDLQSVTPDAKYKDHFVIIDAVGVCEQDKTDSRPMEQKPTVSFEKLLQAVALGNTEDAVLTSLAGRLARMEPSHEHLFQTTG